MRHWLAMGVFLSANMMSMSAQAQNIHLGVPMPAQVGFEVIEMLDIPETLKAVRAQVRSFVETCGVDASTDTQRAQLCQSVTLISSYEANIQLPLFLDGALVFTAKIWKSEEASSPDTSQSDVFHLEIQVSGITIELIPNILIPESRSPKVLTAILTN